METHVPYCTCTTHPNNILYIQSRKNTNTHLDSHTNQKTALSLSTTHTIKLNQAGATLADILNPNSGYSSLYSSVCNYRKLVIPLEWGYVPNYARNVRHTAAHGNREGRKGDWLQTFFYSIVLLE